MKKFPVDGKLKKRDQGQWHKFVQHYVIHFNAAAAARHAGFSANCSRQIGVELLSRPYVQGLIAEERARLGALHYDLSNQVVHDLAVMKDADPRLLFNENGTLKAPHEWPDEEAMLITGFEVEEHLSEPAGDAAPIMTRVKKVRLESRKAVRDSIAKITGLMPERHQMLGKDGKPVDPATVVPVLIVSYGDKLPEKEVT